MEAGVSGADITEPAFASRMLEWRSFRQICVPRSKVSPSSHGLADVPGPGETVHSGKATLGPQTHKELTRSRGGRLGQLRQDEVGESPGGSSRESHGVCRTRSGQEHLVPLPKNRAHGDCGLAQSL